jgi:CelD/BcsL family acetyltransferase involved in cellulose biosynthesis
VLQRLDVDDSCLSLLKKAAAGRGHVRIVPRPSTHFVTVSDYIAPPEAPTLRRKRKKLEAQGFGAEIVVPTVAELPPLLATLLEVESSGWKARRGSSLAVRPDLRNFLVELASRFARRGALTICLLRGPERSIAVRVCLEQGQRFWELKIGYDERRSKYSPCTLLTADTINYAVNTRKSGYEFLGTAEDWQKPWSPHAREHCAWVFYPRSVPGAFLLCLDEFVARLRRT